MNGIGGKWRKEKKWRVIGCREEGMRKMNGVRGGSGLRTDSQRKEQKCEVLQRSGRQMAMNGEYRHTRRMGRAGRTPGVRTLTRFAEHTLFFC